MSKKVQKSSVTKSTKSTKSDLGQMWFDPQSPMGYSGVEKLSRASGRSKKETQAWLRNQLAYSLNKPMRRRFQTRAYKTSGPNDLWQADLMEMIPYASINDGYKYILTCIDVFSRFARAQPIKSKSASDVATALTHMLKDVKPRHLQTDQGLEFYNASVKALLKKHKINHYSVFSQFKAAVIERFNRTLREKLARHFIAQGNKKWILVLPKLIESYNKSKHRGIGMKPIDVNNRNAFALWEKQNKNQTTSKSKKYKVGDYVRISKLVGSAFIKNFDNNWSDEVFKISLVDDKNPVMYSIKDYEDEPIKGKFYQQELQVIDEPKVFRIQEIIRTKGKGDNKQYYVKWHGYSKPSWITEADLK